MVTNCNMTGGGLAVWQVRPSAHFPAGLTLPIASGPPDHIQVTVTPKKRFGIWEYLK